MSVLPNLLRAGDRVAVVAASRRIFPEQMEHAREIFRKWKLKLVEGPHLFDSDGYLAGTDDQRLNDLQQMIDDPEIRAVFMARGGYGATRIIDQLSLDKLKAHPKWIIGFSDVSAIHLKLDHASIPSVHGLMPVQFSYEGVDRSLDSLYQWLFNGHLEYRLPTRAPGRTGSCRATVTGGNLSLLADSLGTASGIDTRGKILLLEEVDEYLYKIDRMMNQLFRAGKLKDLAGVIIGDFSEMKDTTIPFGHSLEELLNRYFTGEYPVAWGLPFGHEPYNLALPFGVPLDLEVVNDSCTLRYLPSV